MAAIYGMIDGSSIAIDLSEARVRDAVKQGWMDAVGFGAGIAFLETGIAGSAAIEIAFNAAEPAWISDYSDRIVSLMAGANAEKHAP